MGARYKANSTLYFQEYIFKSLDAADSLARGYRPLGSADPNQRAALSVREYFGSFFTGQEPSYMYSNETWSDIIGEPEYRSTAQSVSRASGELGRRALTLTGMGPRRDEDIMTGFTGPVPVSTDGYILRVAHGILGDLAPALTLKGDVLDLQLYVDDITVEESVHEENDGQTAFNYLYTKGLKARGPGLGEFDAASGEWVMHQGWPSFMGTLRAGMWFDDFVFETPSPLLPHEMKQDLVNNPFYLSVKPEYSYLEPSYEENIKQAVIKEEILPNLYAFTSEGSGQFRDDDNSIFNQLITLDGRIEGVMVDQVENNIKVGESDEGQYFQKYASAVSSMMENNGNMADLDELATNYQNTFFANDSYNILKNSHEKRNVFPMFVEVEMNTSTDTAVTQMMSELKVNNFLIPRMLYPDPPLPGPQPYDYPMRSITQRPVHRPGSNLDPPVTQQPSNAQKVRTLAIEPGSFKENYLGPIAPENAELNNVVVYGPNGNRIYNDMNQDELYKTIAGAMTSAKLEQVYEANKRTFFEILAGKSAYSEVMAYEICKYSVGGDAQQLISRTVIPNSNKLDIIKYIDTQVKYDRVYEYRIKQLVLVFGARVYFDHSPGVPTAVGANAGGQDRYTEINAWRLPMPGVDDRFRLGSAFIRTIVVPNIKLLEVDYATQSARVVDDPPPPPEVHIVPYKGRDDKILINLNNAFGEFLAPMIPIETQIDNNDNDKFNRVWNSQGQLRDDRGRAVIRFTGDDIAQEFQIYRLEHWPSSYEEFADAELETSPLNTTYRGSRYDSRSLVDYLEPNKYYYYTARTVDYHGFISNPTAIFEVFITSNDGIVMPSIRPVPLATPGMIREPSRTMRRYLQVAPSYINQMIAPEELDKAFRGAAASLGRLPETVKEVNLRDIIVGPAAQPLVWARTFKLRFTSRATGRKFDVNLGVNLSKERQE